MNNHLWSFGKRLLVSSQSDPIIYGKCIKHIHIAFLTNQCCDEHVQFSSFLFKIETWFSDGMSGGQSFDRKG